MTEENKASRFRIPLMIAFFGAIAFVGFGTTAALAIGLNDVPQQFGNILGVDSITAGIILSAAILISVALAVGQAFSKSATPLIPQVISIVAVLAALTAIGWIGIWLILIIVVAFVALVTKRTVDGMNSSGSGD